MTTRPRGHCTAEEKLGIIEEAPQTPVAISEMFRRHGLVTSQFYTREKYGPVRRGDPGATMVPVPSYCRCKARQRERPLAD